MTKIALLFPGQGAQYIGMGKDLYDNFSTAKYIFDEASESIGKDIKKLCFESSIEELTKTENSQPAILTVSYAAFKVFSEETNLIPNIGAGHSLGEYTALTCTGAIKFSDAVKIALKRGVFMQKASAIGEGTMAAVNKIDKIIVEDECRKISDKNNIVVVSAHNSVGQTTISGHKNAVDIVLKTLKAYGADTVYLKVSAPFHSPLMETAAELLREELNKYTFNKVSWPIISNVSGQPYDENNSYIDNLVEQITQPVNWYGTMNYLWETGVTKAIEIGPKSVLKNLVKQKKVGLDILAYDKEHDRKLIQANYKVSENRMRLLGKCLAVVVCTKNKNWDNNEYENGVIKPFRDIQKLKEQLEQAGVEPSIEQMREAINMLLLTFRTKGTPEDEQKERLIEIFNETGTYKYFEDIDLF